MPLRSALCYELLPLQGIHESVGLTLWASPQLAKIKWKLRFTLHSTQNGCIYLIIRILHQCIVAFNPTQPYTTLHWFHTCFFSLACLREKRHQLCHTCCRPLSQLFTELCHSFDRAATITIAPQTANAALTKKMNFIPLLYLNIAPLP